MADITIPPEALEAAARALAVENESREYWWRSATSARAVCLALLKAWPGSYSLTENDSAEIRDVAAIILPLPKEASDE